jgi:hypothetical protein
MTDHTELLKAKQDGTPMPGVDVNEPIAGTYRGNAYRDGPLVPIIIKCDRDREWGGYVITAFLGNDQVPIDRVWPFCAKNPVPKEWVDHYERHGGWPDEHSDEREKNYETSVDAWGARQADRLRNAMRGEPGRGNLHNEPPAFEVIRDQIEAATAGVQDYATITDATKAGAAASLLSRIRGLEAEAETARKAESDPPHAQWKAAIAKWKPIVEKATDAKAALLKALEAYEPPTPSADGKTTIKGGSGRAVSIKPVTEVDEVTDWPALILCMQANEELRELVLKLANKALAVGATVPGVTTKTRKKAK